MTALLTTRELAAACSTSTHNVMRYRCASRIFPAVKIRERAGNRSATVLRWHPGTVGALKALLAGARDRRRTGGRERGREASRRCERAHLPAPRECRHADLPDACRVCEDRYRAASGARATAAAMCVEAGGGRA